MHRFATRHTVSSLFCSRGFLRVSAASPSSNTLNTGEIVDDTAKRYSVLSSRPNTATVNCVHAPFQAFRRHDSTAAEKFEYQAEVSRLMDLIVNSLYSNKEVFLGELISNASDALDKLRFLGVTEPGLLKDVGELDIRIQTDKDNGIITITDSGIGMTRQELVDCLGIIAQNGTAEFLKDNKDAGAASNLIGQFGVGFYSAFLVSGRVEVSTKSPKSDKQYVWEGEANSSSYTIREETDSAKLIPRGTRVTLYLKHDHKGFAHPKRIQKLVQDYSQFVSFPIYTRHEKGYTKEVEVDDKPVEAQKDKPDGYNKLRNPKEVATEEYNEFYKTFIEYSEPLSSSHFTIERRFLSYENSKMVFGLLSFVKTSNSEELYTEESNKVASYEVIRVMLTIDRALFIRENPYVYSPMSIGYNATISAPYMHALCLKLLVKNLRPGMHALVIGSGTGYLTACFALMVGPKGRASGVEHIPELVAESIVNVKRSAAASLLENGSLSLHAADGRLGWPEHSPYDAIYVGAAVVKIPRMLIKQLKPGGKLVIPVGNDVVQDLTVVHKKLNGLLRYRKYTNVRYAPLTDRQSQLTGS